MLGNRIKNKKKDHSYAKSEIKLAEEKVKIRFLVDIWNR